MVQWIPIVFGPLDVFLVWSCYPLVAAVGTAAFRRKPESEHVARGNLGTRQHICVCLAALWAVH